jgi:hypothetical protein
MTYTENSASVATLVRLRFLSALENTEDLLCASICFSQVLRAQHANRSQVVGTDAMIWTLVEPGVAIVAASLATIRPLLRAMKIRGFDSTQRYGTGRSSTARSAGKRINNNNNNNNTGQNSIYAPQDVQLATVERGATLSRDLTGVGLSFDARDKRLEDVPKHHRGDDNDNDDNPSDSKSEVYIIEGKTSSAAWGARDDDDAPSRSLDQIHDLEAQNQEDGVSGLGRRDL